MARIARYGQTPVNHCIPGLTQVNVQRLNLSQLSRIRDMSSLPTDAAGKCTSVAIDPTVESIVCRQRAVLRDPGQVTWSSDSSCESGGRRKDVEGVTAEDKKLRQKYCQESNQT